MGTPPSEATRDGDEAQHEVEIESAFYLGETEVTVAQWARIIAEDPKRPLVGDELPMSGVSWHKAMEFIGRLNLQGERGWRLPTEAEWEYACRAGATTAFSFGQNITPEQVNYNGRYPYGGADRGLDRGAPVPVRSLPANAWGLHEMHGNLWEWCSDLYVVHPEKGQQPRQGPGEPRVMRGGAWTAHAQSARAGYRDGYPPNSSGEKYGFRVAKSLTD